MCSFIEKARDIKETRPTKARKLGRISIGLSVCGIIITITIVVAVVALECKNTYQGRCYRYKTYVGRLRESCTSLGYGAEISDGYCYTYSCHFNYEYDGSCYYYRTYANSSNGCKGVISGYYCYSNYAGIYCPFGLEDRCYWYKTYVGIDGYCNYYKGYLSPSGYCYSGYCSAWAVNGTCYKYAQRVDNYTACDSYTGVEWGDYCYYMSCPAHTYAYNNSCYNYKKLIGILDNCTVGVKSNDYCYFDYCKYFVQGSCYRYRTYVGLDTCTHPGVKSDSYCYYRYCVQFMRFSEIAIMTNITFKAWATARE